jgi:RNA polymerase sigma factor (TIGR02999 family)
MEDDSTGGVKTVTQLLRCWQAGDRDALHELVPLIYGELHKLAANRMNRERPGHTFRPTDLVSELYLRLVEGAPPPAADRVQFFAIAARLMRQILVDSARRRSASKRGGGAPPATLDEAVAAADRPEHLVAIDEALAELSKRDERKARVIELYYFGGLTQDEIALVLDIHVNTVARDLRLGQAWIQTQLDAGGA